MRDRTSKVIRAHLRDADPFRGIATAELDGVCFFLEDSMAGSAIAVRRHGDHDPFGQVRVEGRGGTIVRGGDVVAEFVYDSHRGYTVIPYHDDEPHPRDAVAEHPIDYLLRLACSSR